MKESEVRMPIPEIRINRVSLMAPGFILSFLNRLQNRFNSLEPRNTRNTRKFQQGSFPFPRIPSIPRFRLISDFGFRSSIFFRPSTFGLRPS